MAENSIMLSDGMSAHVPSFLSDVVLVRRDDSGKELYAFSLREIGKEVNIRWSEMTVPVGIGNAGQGIWIVEADIVLWENDHNTINSLQKHLGRVMELHELYLNGASIHTSLVKNGQRVKLIRDGNYKYVVERYANIEKFRNQMGVVMALSDETTGARSLHLKLTGATAEKVNFRESADAFYKRFLTLNQSSGGGGAIK
jgi:hypothetical protein